ncbi:MAG: GAF domain-containing protein [Vulcanimicrobiota bacterium]
MPGYFPDDNIQIDGLSGVCYQGCYKLLSTISSLTGITLSIFSPHGKQITPALHLAPFCKNLISESDSPEEHECLSRRKCMDFHEKLFEEAKEKQEPVLDTCKFGIKSFIYPLKIENRPVFYVVGGHFFSKPGLEMRKAILAKYPEIKEEDIDLYLKTPILDEDKFEAVLDKLSELPGILKDEIEKKDQELKVSNVMSFISEISRELTGDIRLKELLLTIVDRITQTFEVDKCAIALLDDSRKFIEVFASNDEYADKIFGGKIEENKGATGIVCKTGNTLYSYDAQNDRRLESTPLSAWNVKSLLSVPLKVGGHVKGLMHLVSQDKKRLFHQKEIEFVEALASEVSLVIETARLYNETQKRADEISQSRDEMKNYFIKIGKGLSTSLNLKHLLKLIVELSVHLTHADAGSIYLIENKVLSKYVAVTFDEKYSSQKNKKMLETDLPIYTSEHYLDKKFGPGEIKSYLGVPLETKGEIKGLLNIIDRKRREFTPEEVELLSIFAGHAAMGIDNTRLFELEKKKAREASSLYEAARSIGASVTLEEVLDHSVEQLTRVVGVNRCLILLLDYKKLELNVAASKGLSEEQKDFFSVYSLAIDEISDDLWDTLIKGQPLKLTETTGNSAFERFFEVLPTNSCLISPLLSKEQLTGLIILDDSRIAHSFTEAQVRVIMTLAIQIATAIQRATLVDRLEGNLDQLKALHQVSTAVTGTLKLSRVFDLVVDKASHLVNAAATSMLSWEEEKRVYELKASRGLWGELANPELHKRISEKTVRRRRYMTYYVSTDIEPIDSEIHEALKSSSMGGYISIPLVSRKKVVGILNCFTKEGNKFDSQSVRLLRSFANQSAIAIENAGLYAIIRNKVRELATVFDVGKSITSTLELDKVLDEITRQVVSVMEADAASIMLLDKEHEDLRILKTHGLSEYELGETFNVGSGIAGIAVKTSRPMVLLDEDESSSPFKFPRRVKKEGLKSILSVPLKVRDRVIGLINIYKKEIYHFRSYEINLLSTIANSAAVAIENARLYKEQYNVAQVIRRNLMPAQEVEYKGIDVGQVYIPSEILSGDYFEVIPIGNKRYGLVIADVSGKGTEAAIYNARAKYILRSYAVADYSPSQVLTLLNHLMEVETEIDKFISLVYLDLNLNTNELKFSSAGHEPLIIWDDSEKEVKIFENNDLLIGVFPDTSYSEELFQVGPGDIIILYTDGINEARSREGEFFGINRLIEIVRENFHLSSQALANKIHTSVQKFTRRKITDDFSLLIVTI